MGLSKLWQLQEMQLRCQELRNELKASTLARELKAKKEQLETLQNEIQAKNNEYKQSLKDITEREWTCQGLETKKKQIEDKLYSGKINNAKELKNLQSQVELTVKDITKLEKKIQELKTRCSELKDWLIENNSFLQAMKTSYKEELAEYRTWRQGREQEIDILTANAAQLEEDIDHKLSNMYKGLQKRLGTAALSRIINKDTCSYCHLIIPPVLLQEIRAGNHIYCENCGRLILP